MLAKRITKPKRIAFVTAHCYPTPREVRITKIASSLQKKGHACSIFCPSSTEKKDQPKDDNITTVRFEDKEKKFSQFASMTIPINPIWVNWLSRQFQLYQPDVVITRDLRLSLPAIFAAKRINAKTILDIGEHYPGLMKIVQKPGWGAKIYRQPRVITLLEKLTVKCADMVWVVCEDNKKRLSRYNMQTFVINNSPNVDDSDKNIYSPHRPYKEDGEPVRILSFGLLHEIRGLDLAIEAFAILIKKLRNCLLVIMGDGPNRDQLQEQASRLNIESSVEFCGYIEPCKRYQAIASGDIGIVFHRSCDLTQHTLPNKLFDYMRVGLPVVSTPLKPIARILEAEKCGIITAEKPEAVAGALERLILDQNTRRQMGIRGQTAILEHYQWKHEEEKIENYIFELLSGN